MARFKLTIEYDGSNYAGWQRQEGQHSIQAAVEKAIFDFTGESLTISAAGRTDAGVHALGQVAHSDLKKDWSCDTVRDAINAHLSQNGENIAILRAENVDNNFDARFSAKKRHYRFIILNRRAPAALLAKRAWWVPKPLDAEAMHEAAQILTGKHDFTTFRATQCQAKSPIRSLDRLDVIRNDETIEILASARSFLHNQIRSFAGSLMEVGVGRWTAHDLKEALDAKDRKRCGMVAPPFGLYLTQVDYDD
ncbi:tRNA pseudouridine(38-40) synthase TruA [Bartonella tamiae]|uniref:tRNA pseudouridine synthase A n=1 Tax=Bartonella tamiae Th239 TaxID=1094558 RepID=J1K121_9HYPH|nr:tRNA pseudouridine(38-40) synthase TruA [Bartonella tamiae]EJF91137.1 tRNA pseudouridine synthase A [Bartonella tamiae Th239]EJF93198.1 tRNA pseudouridine synthase A [Bartonella tamiae Th307]